MLKKLFYSIAISGLIICPALAEQNPVGSKSDVRIKSYVYDENTVYNLDLHLKSVTAIQFADDEVVRSILIGDSASWEVVKLQSGNVVSIKPVIDAALTNMTIFTDQRVYTFQLKSVGEIKAGAREGAALAFRTSFTYPQTEKPASASAAGQPAEPEDSGYERAGGPVNADYLVSGKSEFMPVSVFDNSMQTIVELAPGSPRPAVFRVGADGKERLVNSRTDGRHIVIDGISNFWVLRIGDERICLAKSTAVRPGRKFLKGIFK